MSDVVRRLKIAGDERNWNRSVEAELYASGCVWIQQEADPAVDVVLLTPVQVKRIAEAVRRAQEAGR